MIVQAAIDIDVDVDFGLARALRIAYGCGSKRLYSDAFRRCLHLFASDDVIGKIECLSRIKGFFTVDLRLLIELCRIDGEALTALGIAPMPKALSKRVVGYARVGGRLCILERTSREGTFIVRLLKTNTLPTVITPSLYLIQATNREIVNMVSEALGALKAFGARVSDALPRICKQG